jgi:LysM repeat protein
MNRLSLPITYQINREMGGITETNPRRRILVLLSIVMVLAMLTGNIASAATVHTVKPGKWLSTIAPKYGITWPG